jgi:hypothetical protein
MGQDLSNESKFVKIGRLEPEISVDKEIASKWKIYISKLKPVKGIERLITRKLYKKTFFKENLLSWFGSTLAAWVTPAAAAWAHFDGLK